MDDTELRSLLEDTTRRFATIGCVIHEWIDYEAMHRGLPRFEANPMIRDWIEDVRRGGGPGEPFDQTHRLLLRPPHDFRLEWGISDADGPRSIEGLDDGQSWKYQPSSNEVWLGSSGTFEPAPAAIGGRLEGAWIDVKGDLFTSLHPSLLAAFDVPDFDRLEVLSEFTHLGRTAVRALAALQDWERSEPNSIDIDEFPPADNYELIIDADTRVLLRIASRFDGQEFSIREMTEVAFDVPIKAAQFAPPPDAIVRRPPPSPRFGPAGLPPEGIVPS